MMKNTFPGISHNRYGTACRQDNGCWSGKASDETHIVYTAPRNENVANSFPEGHTPMAPRVSACRCR